MTIEFTKSRVIPEINYNKVHIIDFHFTQEVEQDTTFKATLKVIWYSQDTPEDQKLFDQSSVQTVEIEDLEELAAEEYAKGNTGILTVLGDLERGLAELLKAKLDIGDTTVTVPTP